MFLKEEGLAVILERWKNLDGSKKLQASEPGDSNSPSKDTVVGKSSMSAPFAICWRGQEAVLGLPQSWPPFFHLHSKRDYLVVTSGFILQASR